MADVNVSFGADMNSMLSAMQEMMRSVTQTMDAVRTKIAGEGRKAFDSMRSGVGEASAAMREQNGTLREIADSAKNAAAQLAGASASKTAFFANFTVSAHGAAAALRKISQAWNAATKFENAAARLAPLVGGLSRSRELCSALRREAADGTADFETLAAAAGKLAAVFKSTESIKRWTKVFHDISAGTGIDSERLIQQFVAAKASGHFEAGFLDQFARRGVNIYEPLAKELNLSEAALRQLASTGELSFAQIEHALLSLTDSGGAFCDAAKRMSSTAGGELSSISAKLQVLLADFAQPIVDSITPVLASVSKHLTALEPVARSVGKFLASDAGAFAALAAAVAVATVRMQGFAAASSFSGVAAGASAAVAKFRALAAGIKETLVVARETGSAFLIAFPKALATSTFATAAFSAAWRGMMLAVKASLISSGIGVAVVAIGEGLSFLVKKLSGADSFARRFSDSMKTLRTDAKALNAAFSDESSLEGVARAKKEKLKETMEAFKLFAKEYGMTLGDLAAAETLYAAGSFRAADYENGGELMELLRKRAEIRRAAGEAEKELIKRQAAEREAAEQAAHAAEIEQMRARRRTESGARQTGNRAAARQRAIRLRKNPH